MVRSACSVLALYLRTDLSLPWFWPMHLEAGLLGLVALELMVARAKVIGKESALFGYSEQMRLRLSCFVFAVETLSRAYSLENVMVSNVGTSSKWGSKASHMFDWPQWLTLKHRSMRFHLPRHSTLPEILTQLLVWFSPLIFWCSFSFFRFSVECLLRAFPPTNSSFSLPRIKAIDFTGFHWVTLLVIFCCRRKFIGKIFWIECGGDDSIVSLWSYQSTDWKAIWNSLQTLIFEGNSYDIENFVTAEAIGTLRPVSSNMSALLINSTVVQHVPLEVSRIPRHKFKIVGLGELHSIATAYAPDESPLYVVDTFINNVVICGYILDHDLQILLELLRMLNLLEP